VITDPCPVTRADLLTATEELIRNILRSNVPAAACTAQLHGDFGRHVKEEARRWL
jgi:hypothetical protein